MRNTYVLTMLNHVTLVFLYSYFILPLPKYKLSSLPLSHFICLTLKMGFTHPRHLISHQSQVSLSSKLQRKYKSMEIKGNVYRIITGSGLIWFDHN